MVLDCCVAVRVSARLACDRARLTPSRWAARAFQNNAIDNPVNTVNSSKQWLLQTVGYFRAFGFFQKDSDKS